MMDVSINGEWISEVTGAVLVYRNIPGLPEATENTVKIAERDGEIDFGSTYGARPVGLGFFITGDYDTAVSLLMRQFNTRRGVLDLVFSDRPGKHYFAQYRGTMSWDESTGNRVIDISLKMYDPFPESDERITELTITQSPQVIRVQSIGDERASPIIVLTNIGTTTLQSFKIKNEYLVEG
ncbi:phage tail domain-containing protein [Paenibacillus woosongensis]|uniref:Phage tail protein n=1 Tax=Paenibacillus woosongensis TaxID=307580 RepID=A0A7X2Z138_9BACL|nr:phage tail domain-containing protein [Paenibacillus woosongensis]MUG45530.1 phage tail protein [Paenibacillus woosongensis]